MGVGGRNMVAIAGGWERVDWLMMDGRYAGTSRMIVSRLVAVAAVAAVSALASFVSGLAEVHCEHSAVRNDLVVRISVAIASIASAVAIILRGSRRRDVFSAGGAGSASLSTMGRP
jgi:hypothetical protein